MLKQKSIKMFFEQYYPIETIVYGIKNNRYDFIEKGREKMRRKDREITDFQEIIKIIDQCEILRLGIADGNFPYIVPVNFAYRAEEGSVELYIHGAKAGRKYELLKGSPFCSFEMDIPLKIELIPERGDVTMRYMSVMGEAAVTFLEGEEKLFALENIIMARHEETRNFEYNRAAVERTAVARLTVTRLTAKANLPADKASK